MSLRIKAAAGARSLSLSAAASVIIGFAQTIVLSRLLQPRDFGLSAMIWAVLGFAAGIASVWLYAAIRPRYGAGAGTAARAGVVVWFFSSLVCTVVIVNMGLLPFNPLPVVWELAQAIVATLIGAWLYKEEGAAAAA